MAEDDKTPKYWQPPEAGVGGPEPLAPIHPEEPREDKDITAGVRSAFFLDPDLSEEQFEVRTEDGIVYLHGTIPSEQTRQRAVDIALGVQGVRDVRDHLRVSPRQP